MTGSSFTVTSLLPLISLPFVSLPLTVIVIFSPVTRFPGTV